MLQHLLQNEFSPQDHNDQDDMPVFFALLFLFHGFFPPCTWLGVQVLPTDESGAGEVGDFECAICLETMELGNTLMLQCGHIFHRACAAQVRAALKSN
jgi:hypothetical protein